MKARIFLAGLAVAAGVGALTAPVAQAQEPPWSNPGKPCGEYFRAWGEWGAWGTGGNIIFSPQGAWNLVCWNWARGPVLIQHDPDGSQHVVSGGFWLFNTRVWYRTN